MSDKHQTLIEDGPAGADDAPGTGSGVSSAASPPSGATRRELIIRYEFGDFCSVRKTATHRSVIIYTSGIVGFVRSLGPMKREVMLQISGELVMELV